MGRGRHMGISLTQNANKTKEDVKMETALGSRVCRHAAQLVPLALLLAAVQAFASGNNNSPPSGAILDLGGGETASAPQTVNHGTPILESVNFLAGLSNTQITFAFREDPAYISFGSVSLVNDTTSSANLLTNGDFSAGTYSDPVSATDPFGNSSVPNGWSYANVYGASAQGQLSTCSGFSSGYCWVDGSVQAYDAIDQTVATTVGDTYTLSFYYTDNGGLTTFSDLSTNGDTTDSFGNGIDILAYAQAGLPPACTPGHVCTGSVPEPSTWMLFAAGLVGLIGVGRRVRRGVSAV